MKDYSRHATLLGMFEGPTRFENKLSAEQAEALVVKQLLLRWRGDPVFGRVFRWMDNADEVSKSAFNAMVWKILEASGFNKLSPEHRGPRLMDEMFFWALGSRPKLHHPEVRKRISLAARQDDVAFFTRLASVLNTRRVSLDKIDQLIISFWAPLATQEEVLGLCDFTDQALADYVRTLLRQPSVGFDLVRKRRQRLKLKKRMPSRVVKVKMDGGVVKFFGVGGQSHFASVHVKL